jgi:hypothetical protein
MADNLPKTTTTNFTAINFREQVAVEEDGTIWEFCQCIDHDGDEIVSDCSSDDIAVIVVKHPSGECWSFIVVADFEDISETPN